MPFQQIMKEAILIETEFLLTEFVGPNHGVGHAPFWIIPIPQLVNQLTFSWTHPGMLEHSPIFEVGHN